MDNVEKTDPLSAEQLQAAARSALASVMARRAVHWRRTRAMTAWLLLLWGVTGFCTVFFARELASFTVAGWPLSFYMAAQGASLVYLALIGLYAWRMRRLDRACQGGDGAEGEP